jgi:hypothetical protein
MRTKDLLISVTKNFHLHINPFLEKLTLACSEWLVPSALLAIVASVLPATPAKRYLPLHLQCFTLHTHIG